MIYSVLFDTKKRENNIEKKNGCHFTWQSLSPEITRYVESAKNRDVREERQAAYVLLFSALTYFFGIDDPVIIRDKGGKPRLDNHSVFFNISHSDGLVLVTLSDERDVGCDIQLEPDVKKQKTLEERFLRFALPCPTHFDIKYFFISENTIFDVKLLTGSGLDFTDKWVSIESIMKLTAEGFSALPSIENIAKNVDVDVRKLEIDKKHFSLANSIKTVKM